ncbi:BURP domain protein USPL1 [Cornus florida]|uniref:BURP domain protein USPL1 n=1 Tax=Cornus florida TaxID=4283 RepID=UPI00289C790A|nr:BURP domain protein USPL1 [Cornus florida]
MRSIFAPCSLLLYVLFVLMCVHGRRDLEIAGGHRKVADKKVYNLKHDMDDHLKIFGEQEEDHDDGHKGMHVDAMDHGHDHPSPSHMDHIEPSQKIFFTLKDLKVGKKLSIYFPNRDPSKTPHLLPREETDSIPFSLSKLPFLLKFFSFSKHSPQAKAMEGTLRHCETQPIKGETKFCATSLESLLDSTRGVFGLETRFKVLTTNHLTNPTAPFQNYTILEVPKEISAPKIVACHAMPYPYAVFYCHSQESDNKLFEVVLGGENGADRVLQALSICHMDTSQWDPDHVAFRVLGTEPGSSPVCHFFPADNLVWVPSPL